MVNYYYELVIKPSEYYNLFLDFLLDIYPDGFEELDGSLILRSENSLDEIIWAVKYFTQELEKKLKKTITVDILLTKKENKDWVEKFKNSIKPVLISSFYIRPSWYPPKDKVRNIILDPASAFGTGHHETTSAVIELMIKYLKPSDTVLDIGTGSRILSLIASDMGAKVDFCDVDSIAVESALKNFKKNNLTFNKSWIGSIDLAQDNYYFILANIIPDVIIAISDDIKQKVNFNSKIILSGILENKADLVLSYFKDFQLIEKLQKGEWITLLLQAK